MEKANDFAAIGINTGNVRTLEPIAMDARQGEVINSVCSTVLPRNDGIKPSMLGPLKRLQWMQARARFSGSVAPPCCRAMIWSIWNGAG